MRFTAELQYGKSGLVQEAKTLLRVILQERLAASLRWPRVRSKTQRSKAMKSSRPGLWHNASY
jgi:hypothetical protein